VKTNVGKVLSCVYLLLGKEDRITLQLANSNYLPIEVEADKVEVQGVLVGIWRSFES